MLVIKNLMFCNELCVFNGEVILLVLITHDTRGPVGRSGDSQLTMQWTQLLAT